jgi:Cft2 family RNA processing exonuclease
MRFINLATHPDIGANSYLLEFGATRLVLDAGTHPKHTGRDTLPLHEDLPRTFWTGSSSAIHISIISAPFRC